MWSTPRASPNENRQSKPTPSQIAGTHGRNLATDVLWPTPSATPYGSSQNGCPGDGRECYAGKGKPSLDTMAVQEGGKLSADWVEILQGFPIGWTDVPVPGRKVEVEVDEHGQTRFVELRVMKQGKARTVDRVPLPVREPSPWPGWPAPPGPQHDYEPPRITERKDGRPQRLRALGNGCVPQQIALVGLVIRALEGIRK